MPGKTLDYLRRLSEPREIEDSRGLRWSIWAAVSLSLFALALQEVTSPSLTLAAIALISAGSYASWRRRYKRNVVVKSVIGVLMLAALGSFLRQVYVEPFDPRLPMAELFVWIQVLHSFDLPRRKDLMLALVSSLILLGLAGSFAMTASFAWLVLLWLSAALPSLYLAHLSRLGDLSAAPETVSFPRLSLKTALTAAVLLFVAVAMAGTAIGAAMPRVSATYLHSLPFSLRRAFNPSSGYRFDNPGYPDLPTRPPDRALEVNPEAYFGFSPYLDLRTRGRLSGLPVMKVRSTEPAYWGGMAFQDYNGYSWLASEEEPSLLRTSTQPFEIEYGQDQAHVSDRRIIQTFYVEAEQPNVVFAAYRPDLVYFPSDYLYQDNAGLKSPYALDQGLVYSVVSDPTAPESALAASPLEASGETLQPYLQLPALPRRVAELVEEIVPQGAAPLDRAQAIEDYLKRTCSYSLDVPPLPDGRDAVDFFLFDQRSGYCEHFATAYAVMCRLAGIPSRVVTGYAVGDYNPFTGLYEVCLDDAHAWTEIYLESVGWVTRDPTPGFSVPSPDQGSGSLWILDDLFSWFGSRISSLLPSPIRSALKAVASGAVSAAKAVASGLLYAAKHAYWSFLLLALCAILALLLRAARASRRRRALAADLDGAVLAMHEFLASLESLGLRRDPSQTAEEYALRLGALVPGLDLTPELGLFERARYGFRPLAEEELGRLRKGLARAEAEVRSAVTPGWRQRLPRKPRTAP